ncbi:antigen 5 like allergen Cul n 1-like [Teleopsis dalmanni]|uniref:antigen 5 like allergen Cul n 1-like n=1 Tax=Teleopsis dalmanni TaxID=139649 RepID=UPI0018CDF46E|nr:antigen 5 like allergen Cul n 1-like [Teleopsis dalmanni]
MNIFVLINVILLILFNNKYGSATNYCAKNLCDVGKKHIACKNNGNFSRNCSTNARLINMNHYKHLILKAHNVRRNNLARGLVPGYRPASRMATMQWSNELAYLAGLNVRQCAMKHDQCHNTYAFPTASQNLGFIGNTRLFAFFRIDWIIKNRINEWWQEYKLINMTKLSTLYDYGS